MSSVLTDRFADALRVATSLHDDSDEEPPHASHLLQVAGMVLEAGGSEEQAIAALFHDAIETASTDDEAEARESRIREEFGDRPADMVVAVTDGTSTGDDDEGWKEGKEQYIHHLWTEADDEAVQLSAADKLSTARAMLRDYQKHGEAAWARYEGGRSGALWYYRALVGAYRYRGLDGHVDELEHIVTTLEEETALA